MIWSYASCQEHVVWRTPTYSLRFIGEVSGPNAQWALFSTVRNKVRSNNLREGITITLKCSFYDTTGRMINELIHLISPFHLSRVFHGTRCAYVYLMDRRVPVVTCNLRWLEGFTNIVLRNFASLFLADKMTVYMNGVIKSRGASHVRKGEKGR